MEYIFDRDDKGLYPLFLDSSMTMELSKLIHENCDIIEQLKKMVFRGQYLKEEWCEHKEMMDNKEYDYKRDFENKWHEEKSKVAEVAYAVAFMMQNMGKK